MKSDKLSAISIFSGAMGLDLGIEKAGFGVRACVELDKKACETIKLNRPHMTVLERDVCTITGDELLKAAGLKKGQLTLLFGGPPCQSFSTAGTRASFTSEKGNALLEFLRLIEETKPEYFVFENVKGLLSAAIKHRPLSERGKGALPLDEDEKQGSVVRHILERLSRLNYQVEYKLINSANYGVPQTRQRVFFIGSRDGYNILMPQPTHNKEGINAKKWVTFGDLIRTNPIEKHTFIPYKESKLKYMKMIPKGGGNWRDLPKDLQPIAMGGAYKSGGGKVGFYRRISLDKPAPTMLTSPSQKSTNLGHPIEDRPLSVEEYKLIQQFPEDWKLAGGIGAQYKQLGNAVPIGLAYALGKAVHNHIVEMKGLKTMDNKNYNIVSKSLENFYTRRIDKLEKIDIFKILKRKNPYLYRSVGSNNAYDFMVNILSDSQTSSDETIFGEFFEDVAIAVSGGVKSTTDSVDLEIREGNTIKLIAVKSGPHVFNSQSRAKQVQAFKEAVQRLRNIAVEPVVGYAYGRKKSTNIESKTNFDEYAGQRFWTYITGNEEFYMDLIKMVGRASEEHREQFEQAWERVVNKQYMKFMNVFCDKNTGNVDWETIMKYNSGKEVPKEILQKIKEYA